MTEDPKSFRMERIEKLLNELRYEVERGMMQQEIGEEIEYSFIIPISSKIPKGVVVCRFQTRPRPRYEVMIGEENLMPRLRIVK